MGRFYELGLPWTCTNTVSFWWDSLGVKNKNDNGWLQGIAASCQSLLWIGTFNKCVTIYFISNQIWHLEFMHVKKCPSCQKLFLFSICWCHESGLRTSLTHHMYSCTTLLLHLASHYSSHHPLHWWHTQLIALITQLSPYLSLGLPLLLCRVLLSVYHSHPHPREHTYRLKKCITWMHCKSLWIKASVKCINVNVIADSYFTEPFLVSYS